ncbi:hypothetical protein [Nocardioides albus]|uniref:Uncharacterized protein n=1 Tax=Nocardioides albus TaxID=1841 RepID=A0A7W5A887_9ACTN|nr:hypothetical protein [Nocardioides albus]MBB3091305.1 hypothetical protein [Nocardioides albus]GGU40121.1 hypothetical protein GCM10007979_44240 [Nocardioides albus]
MSRRRSAYATVVVLGVLAFFYSLALAIPVSVEAVWQLWETRGLNWMGVLVGRMVDGFTFLWGSAVTHGGYVVTPVSIWPTVVFVVLLASLVYLSLRTASENAYSVAGRVLCASVLTGGLTNLFVVLQATAGGRGGLDALPSLIWALPDDGIWIGAVMGVLGGYAALVAAAFGQVASIALRADATDDSDMSPKEPLEHVGRGRAMRIATWGTLPLLVVALVGGFVWDYGPDADPYGARLDSVQAWIRLVWFGHASLSGPHNPHSLSGEFDTSVWLTRTLSSAVLVALVWLVMLLMVSRWQGERRPGVLCVVVQCWGVVAVLAALVGMVEGALVRQEAFATTAPLWALEVAGQGVRFGAVFGWATGVAVILAHRFSRGARADAEAEGE